MAKTASDYLAEAAANAQAGVPKKAAPKKYSIVPMTSGIKKSSRPQSPLNWLMDIITRPLSGVTNAIQSSVNAGVDASKLAAKGDVGGAIGKGLEAANVPGNFLTGLLSDKPEQHRTFSQVIEQSTDKFGSLDPKYKDTVDNVNPVLKGVLGFAGDVALDPLTWIPGGVLLKGAKGLGSVAKGMTTGATGAIKAMQAAKKGDAAAEAAAKAASAISKPTVASAEGAATAKLATALDEQAAKAQEKAVNVATQSPEDLFAQSKAATEAALSSTKAKVVKDTLSEFKPGISSKPSPEVAAATAKALSDAPVKLFDKGWLKEAEIAMGSMKLSQAPKVFHLGKQVPMPSVLLDAQKGDRVAIESLKNWHQDKYIPAYQTGKDSGYAVDALGRTIENKDVQVATEHAQQEMDAAAAVLHAKNMVEDPQYASNALDVALHAKLHDKWASMPTMDSLIERAQADADSATKALSDALGRTTSATHTVLTARGAFQEKLAENRALLEEKLGPKLVTSLVRNSAHASQDVRFDKVMSELHGILDRNINLHDVQAIQPASDRMLQHIGVDFKSLPKEIRVAQDVPATEPLPKSLTETLALMGEDVGADVAKAVEKGLSAFVQKDIIDVRKLYPETTKTGAKATLPAGHGGLANIEREMNQFTQNDILHAITVHYSDMAKRANKGKALGGGARAAYMNEHVLPAMRLAERVLDQRGVPFVLGVDVQKRIPLSASQTIDILNDINPEVMRPILWNNNTAVAPTNLLDATYIAAHGGTPAEVEAAIRQATSYRGKEIPNNIVDPVISTVNGKRYMYGPKILSGDALVASLRDTLMEAAPRLRAAAEANAAAFEKRGLGEATLMLDTTLNELEAAFTEGRVADLMTGINDASTRVAQMAEKMGATDLGKGVAASVEDSLIGPYEKAVAAGAVDGERISKAASKVALAKKGKTGAQTAEEIQRAGVNNANKASDNAVAELLKDEPVTGTLDLGDKMLADINGRIASKFKDTFSREWRMKAIHDEVVQNENIWHNIVGTASQKLNAVSRVLPRERIDQVFAAVQKGVVPADPELAKHYPAIKEIWEDWFGRADSISMMDSRFFLNNSNLEHVNAGFRKYEVPFEFNLEKAQTDAIANGTSFMHEAMKQPKTWEVTDAAEFLNKISTVGAKIMTDQAVASSWLKTARDLDAVSMTPRAGWVEFTDPSGKSIMAKYLPSKMYVHPDVAEQLHAADVLMQRSVDFGGDFGHVVRDIIKPASDMWKAGITILNPIHHERNFISDSTLTYLAEGSRGMSRSFKDALQIMAVRGDYTNASAIQALEGINVAHTAGKVITKGFLGGKAVSATADKLYTVAADGGLLPKFHTLESMSEQTDVVGSGLGKWWEKTRHNNPVMRAAASVTEARDHYSRLAHFSQIVAREIEKKGSKFKSEEELYAYAIKRVRKWHPDGSDMTNSEQMLKMIIPFYSWQRKTIPLIAEAMLTNPNRISILPKASYNVAVAMGVNPDTLSDPFPDDQMFPSYLTNQIAGPNFQIGGKYYGINPGFASNDILNDYLGSNPAQTILGSVNPIIKAPFELSAGANVGTGAKINDASDYIDSQLPIVSPIARMTGNSVTGSLVSMLQGKGLDPQYQVSKGNKTQGEASTIGALNYLLGTGIVPMSQPNQINYAEIEKKNRAKAAASGRSGF